MIEKHPAYRRLLAQRVQQEHFRARPMFDSEFGSPCSR